MDKRLGWLFVGAVLLAGVPATGWAQGERPEEVGGEEHGPGAAPTAAEEETALSFLKENNPEMFEGLSRAKKENPAEYKKHIAHIAEETREPAMREVMGKTMKSGSSVRRLTDKLHRAQGADKEKVKADLKLALSEQFDAKLLAHEMRVKKMETEIARIKDQVARRRARKAELIKKRLADLSGEGEGDADW